MFDHFWDGVIERRVGQCGEFGWVHVDAGNAYECASAVSLPKLLDAPVTSMNLLMVDAL